MTFDELKARYERLQKKITEYRDEAFRCREIARQLANARGTNAVLAGVYPDPKNKSRLLLFICAPNLDESNFEEAAQMLIREFWAGAKTGAPTPKVVSFGLTGTEGDK